MYLLHWQILTQHRFQQCALDRLAQIIREARRQILLPRADNRIRRQRDERRLITEMLLPHPAQRFHAIHTRHHMIQQHHIELLPLQRLDAGRTAGRQRYLHLRRLQQALDHEAVHPVIIHRQHLCLRRRKRLMVAGLFRSLPAAIRHKIAQRRFIHDSLRQPDRKRRPLAIHTVHLHLPAHKANQAMRQGQPQTGSLHIAVLLLIQPHKILEQILHILVLDADAGIRHPDLQRHRRPAAQQLLGCRHFRPARQSQRHTALLRILHRIVQDIDDDLAHPRRIAINPPRQALLRMQLESQPLLLRLDLHHIHDIRQHIPQIIFRRHDIHLAGLDLGKVQHIIDERQQRLARAIDILRILAHIRVLALAQDHLIHAHDRIDWRADLMAHIRQEITLGLIRLIRQPLRLAQLIALPGAFLRAEQRHRHDDEQQDQKAEYPDDQPHRRQQIPADRGQRHKADQPAIQLLHLGHENNIVLVPLHITGIIRGRRPRRIQLLLQLIQQAGILRRTQIRHIRRRPDIIRHMQIAGTRRQKRLSLAIEAIQLELRLHPLLLVQPIQNILDICPAVDRHREQKAAPLVVADRRMPLEGLHDPRPIRRQQRTPHQCIALMRQHTHEDALIIPRRQVPPLLMLTGLGQILHHQQLIVQPIIQPPRDHIRLHRGLLFHMRREHHPDLVLQQEPDRRQQHNKEQQTA